MTQGWKHIKTIVDGQKFNINGFNIWDFQWNPTGEKIIIKDPLYGQSYTFNVYEIQNSKIKVLIAAGEFSNGVYGIFQRKKISKLDLFKEKIAKIFYRKDH